MLEALIKRRFVDVEDGRIYIHAWDEHEGADKGSYERVKDSNREKASRNYQRQKEDGADDASSSIGVENNSNRLELSSIGLENSFYRSNKVSNGEINNNDKSNMVSKQAARFGLPLDAADLKTIERLIKLYPVDWIVEAIDRAGRGKSQTWAYVTGILKSWQSKGEIDGDWRLKPDHRLPVENY